MSEDSVNIVVNYAFQRLGAAALREEERWGFGKMVMNAERFPTTPEELEEVGRTIGLEKEYEMVAIQHITRLEDEIQQGDVVVGEVVVDGNILEEDS